jgi:hypothetical protein
VAEFRSVLNLWMNSRRQTPQLCHYTEAPEYIDWPQLNAAPQEDPEDLVAASTVHQGDESARSDADNGEVGSGFEWSVYRRDKREQGQQFLKWQRPPQSQIPQGCYVLASGAMVSEER